ncbi:unnamed protein product [Caenorhabditis sp. 36 PRJEB53466]|nr:unnamed protein product [Caenorhabditis sp. 36 PRJEB53466]
MSRVPDASSSCSAPSSFLPLHDKQSNNGLIPALWNRCHPRRTRARAMGHEPGGPANQSVLHLQARPARRAKGHDYSRAGNPTRDVLQKNLAALEDAKHCQVFSSGLAASSAVINLLKVGDHIVCSDDVYGGTQRYIRKVSVPNHGLEVDFVDLTKIERLEKAIKPTRRSSDCQEANPEIFVVVDNTFMSPYFQRPISLGADIVVHSITKYINGHSDVVMGAVVTDNDEVQQHLFFMQLAVGAVPSPFDCFLVNRGLKTLHIRMKAHYENALAIAKYLEVNDRVESVLYPALESHPQHEVHEKQTKGMSGMISFYLKGELQESRSFLSALKVFTLAESLGGYESLAELPAIMTHASVPAETRAELGITDNLIRISVGIEDLDDLVADLDQALKVAIPKV